MTPEEREQLRRDLEAAGCPELANAVNEWPHLMTAELPELRSLLRRANAGGVKFAIEGEIEPLPYDDNTIDAEVPDGQC